MTTAATLASNASLMTTPSGTAPSYLCRAWVNFNGTGTVAIRASGNVSSVTDGGVGTYTVNFTTAMPDASYSIAGIPGVTANRIINATSKASGSAAILVSISSTNTNSDETEVTVAIFR